MLKNQIFAAQDTKVEECDVPEWGVKLHLRTLSGADRAKLRAAVDRLEKQHREAEADTYLVLLCASDPNGNPVFTDADFDQLNSKSATVLSRVAAAALKLNGLGVQGIEDAKKNS